ncbi:hypothetical protein QBC42DRAFT_253128 [Cladorrhinum samala]|uniref:RING-type domain-containing protein n=1 Tax=Cladorrhinum samala TaxID=585594 RepID=A0AAV9HLD6_9PEZI|nr:hypothetical protein QBC42DRAFT_253128 [Cladorrhinum samala]
MSRRSSFRAPSGRSSRSTTSTDQQSECIICMEEMALQAADVRVLPCGHCFHAHCVIQWQETSDTCPICRRPATGTVRNVISEGTSTTRSLAGAAQSAASSAPRRASPTGNTGNMTSRTTTAAAGRNSQRAASSVSWSGQSGQSGQSPPINVWDYLDPSQEIYPRNDTTRRNATSNRTSGTSATRPPTSSFTRTLGYPSTSISTAYSTYTPDPSTTNRDSYSTNPPTIGSTSYYTKNATTHTDTAHLATYTNYERPQPYPQTSSDSRSYRNRSYSGYPLVNTAPHAAEERWARKNLAPEDYHAYYLLYAEDDVSPG